MRSPSSKPSSRDGEARACRWLQRAPSPPRMATPRLPAWMRLRCLTLSAGSKNSLVDTFWNSTRQEPEKADTRRTWRMQVNRAAVEAKGWFAETRATGTSPSGTRSTGVVGVIGFSFCVDIRIDGRLGVEDNCGCRLLRCVVCYAVLKTAVADGVEGMYPPHSMPGAFPMPSSVHIRSPRYSSTGCET